MNLYFENSNGVSRKIAEVANELEISMKIKEFIDECNKHKSRKFVSYYTRKWTENGRTWYDVGSHTEYFWVDKELKSQ